MKKYLDNIYLVIHIMLISGIMFIGTALIISIMFNVLNLKHNDYDVNRDEKVNAQDYTEIKNYIMNRED